MRDQRGAAEWPLLFLMSFVVTSIVLCCVIVLSQVSEKTPVEKSDVAVAITGLTQAVQALNCSHTIYVGNGQDCEGRGTQKKVPGAEAAADFTVLFDAPRYHLSKDPLEQMAERQELPEIVSDGRDLVVAGCADMHGFFARDAAGQVIVNQHAEDQSEGVLPAANFAVYREITQGECDDISGCPDAMNAANRRLNCGLANLRGLSVIAEILEGDGWQAALPRLIDEHLRVALPGDEGQGFAEAHARFLDALCAAGDRLRDATFRDEARGISVVLQPASSNAEIERDAEGSEAGHTCWPEGRALERSAVIHLPAADEGGSRCPVADAGR